EWREVFAGFVPTARSVVDPAMLYISIGIIGATVMPHNLYLHSSTVQTRRFELSHAGRKNAITFATVDVVVALCVAFLINAAILVTSAAVFHANGYREVAELQEAYRLLGPLTGTSVATVLFGLALLASGQGSAVTATMAGQIVMEGYVDLRMRPWARRLLTRSLAIVPAFFALLAYGETGLAKLLVLSQVILSLQLPFAMVPLVRFTGDRKLMGEFVNSSAVKGVALAIVAAIITLNAVLIWQTIVI
ncbi:MAG: divalent metal cation transporter, partial [Gammaproteobacteria bacterium]